MDSHPKWPSYFYTLDCRESIFGKIKNFIGWDSDYKICCKKSTFNDSSRIQLFFMSFWKLTSQKGFIRYLFFSTMFDVNHDIWPDIWLLLLPYCSNWNVFLKKNDWNNLNIFFYFIDKLNFVFQRNKQKPDLFQKEKYT